MGNAISRVGLNPITGSPQEIESDVMDFFKRYGDGSSVIPPSGDFQAVMDLENRQNPTAKVRAYFPTGNQLAQQIKEQWLRTFNGDRSCFPGPRLENNRSLTR